MRDEVVTTILGVLGGGGAVKGVSSWWARGGQKRTKIDTATAITAAADAVVQLMTDQLGGLRARVDAAEQQTQMLVQIVQRQQVEGRALADWSRLAAVKLRESHIEIEDPPTWTDAVIPTSVTVTTTRTRAVETHG